MNIYWLDTQACQDPVLRPAVVLRQLNSQLLIGKNGNRGDIPVPQAIHRLHNEITGRVEEVIPGNCTAALGFGIAVEKKIVAGTGNSPGCRKGYRFTSLDILTFCI